MIQPKNETEWQKILTAAAVELGWEWLHIGRVGKYQANGAKGTLGKGWPDLVLIKSGRMPLFVECKMPGEHLTDDQAWVLTRLQNCGQRTYVWRPGDFALAMDILANEGSRL